MNRASLVFAFVGSIILVTPKHTLFTHNVHLRQHCMKRPFKFKADKLGWISQVVFCRQTFQFSKFSVETVA
jgi:hypothetical protein